jgi:hypothetical protein
MYTVPLLRQIDISGLSMRMVQQISLVIRAIKINTSQLFPAMPKRRICVPSERCLAADGSPSLRQSDGPLLALCESGTLFGMCSHVQ